MDSGAAACYFASLSRFLEVISLHSITELHWRYTLPAITQGENTVSAILSRHIIQSYIDLLREKDAYSESAYVALLRILLSPSGYAISENDLPLIVSALRDAQSNSNYRRVMVLLHQLAPISS